MTLFARAIVLLALVIAWPIGQSQAQTIGYAQAIQIMAKDCGSDIDKFCKNATLANFGIGRCLDENRARLSNQCATTIPQVRASLQARAEAQAAAPQICRNDIRRLCPLTERGQGHILRCMLKAEPSVSAKCNAAITNAGWR